MKLQALCVLEVRGAGSGEAMVPFQIQKAQEEVILIKDVQTEVVGAEGSLPPQDGSLGTPRAVTPLGRTE